MGAWILIVVLHGYTGLATTNVEFPTEAGCIEAGKTVIAKHKATVGDKISYYVCMEKK